MKNIFKYGILLMLTTMINCCAPTRGDYDIALPNNYSLVRSSGHMITINKQTGDGILSEPYDTGSDALEYYGIYNVDVISPVSGKIIDLQNSEEDILPNLEKFKSLLGNYIFIEIESTGTYLIMAHFKKDSITVSVGDYVEEGAYIGKVGNSGTTSEPHLHIQHQRNNPMTMIFPTLSEGLPINFKLPDK